MATLKPVLFHDVAIGHFFKDRADGTWHLKTAADRAMYQAADVRDEPQFSPGETVYIDPGEAKAGKIFSDAAADSFMAFAPRRGFARLFVGASE